jgi:3-hydroxyacyl-[acyl-carrier-protein] dehydratase
MSERTVIEIMNVLPHRYPFLLVDKVLEFKANETMTAIKNVTASEPYFQGHFPGFPVMPGVLILEALAQAGGVLMMNSIDEEPTDDDIFVLAGIDGARFKRVVMPGDQLKLEIEVIRAKRAVWKFTGKATVDGELAASATILNARGLKSSIS